MTEHTAAPVARRPLVWVIVCVGILIPAVVTRCDPRPLQRPFGTDEADYVRALSFGLKANYLGSNERPGATFLRGVVAEYRATGWAHPFERDWQQRDAAGLRHYHPPLGLYPAATLAGTGLRDERTLRLIPVALGVLTCLCAALLAGVTTDGRSHVVAALVAGLLVASSPYHIEASTELSFHAAFALLSTLSLVCLVMTARTGRTAWWHGASIMLGLTLLTVPYWVALLPPYLWVGWSVIRRDIGAGRAALASLGVIGTTLLVAWPPFLASAAFVKPALMYGGIMLMPLPGTATPSSWLVQLGATHWLTLSCVAAGLAGWLANRCRVPRPQIPSLLFCAAFVLVNARVAHMKPLYAADLIAPLSALAAASLLTLAPVLQPLVVVTAIAVTAHAMVPTRAQERTPTWRSDMDALSRTLSATRVLVTPRPAAAIVTYYAQDSHVILDSGDATEARALRAAAARGEIDVVLQWGSTFEPGGVARELVSSPPDASFTIEQTLVRLTRLAPQRAVP